MLEEKTKAPVFRLKNNKGEEISLSDFLGKKVIIYFYPKDNTPGCTRQACSFRDNYDEFKRNDIVVIGVSKDSEKSHQSFIEKYNLPFILLSDPELNVIKSFGVWQEKKMYGKTTMGVVRSTFIIDEKGYIEKVFKKANPDTNATDILEYLIK